MEALAAKSAIPPARFLLVKTIAVRGLLIGRPALEAETSEAARSERPARGPLGTGSPARFVHANRGPHRTLPTHNRSKSRAIKPQNPRKTSSLDRSRIQGPRNKHETCMHGERRGSNDTAAAEAEELGSGSGEQREEEGISMQISSRGIETNKKREEWGHMI